MAIVIFYVALVLIASMLAVKYFDVPFFRHQALADLLHKNEKHMHQIVENSKQVAAKIQYKNFHRLALATAGFVKQQSIRLKRALDSKQPKFFLKPDQHAAHKGSVSFFLTKVAEHKDALKKKRL